MLLERFVLILELHWFKEQCLEIKLCVLIMPKVLILLREILIMPQGWMEYQNMKYWRKMENFMSEFLHLAWSKHKLFQWLKETKVINVILLSLELELQDLLVVKLSGKLDILEKFYWLMLKMFCHMIVHYYLRNYLLVCMITLFFVIRSF